MGPKEGRHKHKDERNSSPPQVRPKSEQEPLSSITADTKLTYKPDGNEAVFAELTKVLFQDLVNNHGYPLEVAMLLTTGSFGEVEEISTDGYNPAEDLLGFEKEKLKVRIKHAEEKKILIAQKKKTLCPYLESKCTRDFFSQLGLTS